jgi:hypothetical protein
LSEKSSQGENSFAGCHCERSEAIPWLWRLLRRFTPRNDKVERFSPWNPFSENSKWLAVTRGLSQLSDVAPEKNRPDRFGSYGMGFFFLPILISLLR